MATMREIAAAISDEFGLDDRPGLSIRELTVIITYRSDDTDELSSQLKELDWLEEMYERSEQQRVPF